MNPYEIQQGTSDQREAVTAWLAGLDRVSPPVRERIVTSWVSSWRSSTHERLEDMPYSMLAPGYKLVDHVNEVTRTGIDLALRAAAEWNDPIDFDTLISVLVTHDVDKPLIYVRENDTVRVARLAREIPHGVLGAMLLKDLGFPHLVVSAVATHASNAPFHGSSFEAYVLHYADYFVTDRACMRAGSTPFYQRHLR